MASIFLRGKTWFIQYYRNGQKTVRTLKTQDKQVAKFEKNKIENAIVSGTSTLPKPNTAIQDIFDEYQKYSQTRKSKDQVKVQASYLKYYFEWAQVFTIGQITKKSMEEYLGHRLSSKTFKVSSANNALTVLKAFLNFSIERGYLNQNPLKSLRKIAEDKLPPRFLTKDEIFKVLESAKGEMVYPMIATAIYTGMRLGELKRLEWKDVDLKEKRITVRYAKSKKFRIIPLHSSLEYILTYLTQKDDQKIFNVVNIRRVFRRIKIAVGIPELGWHTFRHTFISHLIMSGVDLPTAAKLAGHADITTTMIYTHLTRTHIDDAVKKLSF